MENYTGFWLGLILLLLICVLVMVIVGIGLLSGFMASYFGFTGWKWWCVTLLAYVVLGGFVAMLYR